MRLQRGRQCNFRARSACADRCPSYHALIAFTSVLADAAFLTVLAPTAFASMLSAPAFLTVGLPGSPTSLAHSCWPRLSFASDKRLVQKFVKHKPQQQCPLALWTFDVTLPTSLIGTSDDADSLGAMLVMALMIPDDRLLKLLRYGLYSVTALCSRI
jgi:hypothetical protein